MATKNTRTQAGRTRRAAKSTARKAGGTTKQAARTTVEAERTGLGLARDGVYAALGVGDTAVAVVRSLPRRAEELRTKAPSLADDVPGEVRSAIGGLVKTAGKNFDAYAQRGRAVAQSIGRSRATQRALDQSKVARSQVKSATTSVRKAVGEGVDAAGTAADRVGDPDRE